MDHSELARELISIGLAQAEICREHKLKQYSKGEMLALHILSRGDTISKNISEEMGVSTARVAAMLNGMEQKGYIERKTDERCRRKTIVSMLPEGRRVYEAELEKLTAVFSRIMLELGDEDAAELVRLERRITLIIGGMLSKCRSRREEGIC